MTITEKREVIFLNNWLKFDEKTLEEYKCRNLDYTKKGEVLQSNTNLITVIVNPSFCEGRNIIKGKIFFDICSRKIYFYGYFKGKEHLINRLQIWDDYYTNALGIEIEKEFGIRYSKNKMTDVVTFIANKNTVNLPALYMNSLSYKGRGYIEKLMPKYLGVEDNSLNKWIAEHMLVGMVKRVFEPGCKFNELVVLTGEQGVGKTSFIERLALNPKWYCSLSSIKGKDAISNLVGKVVVELEEFVALRNSKSADEAKLFISSRVATARLAYERTSADIERTCILITTTNDATFLGDFSGERRYLSIRVNGEKATFPLMYDVEKFPMLKEITREEHEKIVREDFLNAVAEAVYLYKNKMHEFYIPSDLRGDLNLVIQTHKNDSRHIQNFLDFMEWKREMSDTPNILCSAEFTSRYPETNEKIFAELMANEAKDEWILKPSVKSVKHKIDGCIRVSKKFYVRLDNN